MQVLWYHTGMLMRRWFWFRRRHQAAIWMVGLVLGVNLFAFLLIVSYNQGWVK